MVRKHLGLSEWKKINQKNIQKFLPTTKGGLSHCPSKLPLESKFIAKTNLPNEGIF